MRSAESFPMNLVGFRILPEASQNLRKLTRGKYNSTQILPIKDKHKDDVNRISLKKISRVIKMWQIQL